MSVCQFKGWVSSKPKISPCPCRSSCVQWQLNSAFLYTVQYLCVQYDQPVKKLCQAYWPGTDQATVVDQTMHISLIHMFPFIMFPLPFYPYLKFPSELPSCVFCSLNCGNYAWNFPCTSLLHRQCALQGHMTTLFPQPHSSVIATEWELLSKLDCKKW